MQSFLQYRRLGHVVRKQLDDVDARPDATAAVKETVDPVEQSNRPTANPDGTGQDESKLSPGPVARRDSRASEKTALAYSLAGVDVRKQVDSSNQHAHQFVVGWDGENDPLCPRNLSFSSRLVATLLVSALGWVVGAASSINSGVLPQNTEAFHVSDVVGSLVTGKYYSPPFERFNQFLHGC